LHVHAFHVHSSRSGSRSGTVSVHTFGRVCFLLSPLAAYTSCVGTLCSLFMRRPVKTPSTSPLTCGLLPSHRLREKRQKKEEDVFFIFLFQDDYYFLYGNKHNEYLSEAHLLTVFYRFRVSAGLLFMDIFLYLSFLYFLCCWLLLSATSLSFPR
jgi:hypothetical protein